MRKIGILTYFWADNPGTFLQAYATQEAFRRRLPKDRVELVNYRHRHVYFKPSKRHINPFQFLLDAKRYWIYEKSKAQHLILSREKLISKDYNRTLNFIKELNYDMLVSGADVILHFMTYHLREESVPIYWLPPELTCIKAMCASSGKALTLEDISEKQKRLLKKCIDDIQLIGVRDDATYNLMLDLGLEDKSKLELLPDPTFSLDIDYSHIDSFIAKRKINLAGPRVLFSLPKNFLAAPELSYYYKKQGYRVFSLNHAPYADISLTDISPFEWAGIYKYFDCVLTYRFHGTLFSILNNTPVVSIICQKGQINNRGQSKYASLWNLFGLELTNGIDATENIDNKILI